MFDELRELLLKKEESKKVYEETSELLANKQLEAKTLLGINQSVIDIPKVKFIHLWPIIATIAFGICLYVPLLFPMVFVVGIAYFMPKFLFEGKK